MIIVKSLQKCYNYPLILIGGSVIECGIEKIIANNGQWPVVNNRFKVLVHLRLGHNRIKLSTDGGDSLELNLEYRPPGGENLVRLVYLDCLDSNGEIFDQGRFESGEEENNSAENASQRLSLGLLMCQCFFAQTLPPPNNCFQLELDSFNWPIVHRVTLRGYDRHQLWSLTGEQLWKLIANQLMNSDLSGPNIKFIAFCSFSRYVRNPNADYWLPTEQVKGYVSMGGNHLATLSTHCLYTWPETVAQIPIRLSDSRLVDSSRFMDDSDHRHYRWSCFVTTLGATIHELAHTFQLAHSQTGIMGQDFNQIHLLFQASQEVDPKWWSESQIAILANHRWFRGKSSPEPEQVDQIFRIQNGSVWSRHGLVVVEYRHLHTRNTFFSLAFPQGKPPKRYRLIREASQQKYTLFIMDTNGNVFNVKNQWSDEKNNNDD